MTVQKISVVTVCLNVQDCIRLTLESVARQSFGNIEHVIIDGGSNDGTQRIINEYSIGYFVSEKDNGVYHAMDKGAQAATGDILIFLNAGDTFYDDRACEDVADFFDETKADIVFGNLMPVYLKSTDTHDHGAFTSGKLLDIGYIRNRRQLFDESIHHQATFYRKWIFKRCTYLCSSPEANGEYNLLLNATMKHHAKVKHIKRPISRFVLGGISTRNFELEWGKYVKARDILRSLYCPSIKSIKIKSESEFCHVGSRKVLAPRVGKTFLKKLIKHSVFFRIYERLSFGLSSRIVNIFTPEHERILELQTQRIFNDLTHVIEKNIQAHLEQVKKQIKLHDASSKASVEDVNVLVVNAVSSMKYDMAIIDKRMGDLNRLAIQTSVNLADMSFTANKTDDFSSNGFRVFSQWDEDGLIQYLISRIPECKQSFVEFGVGDYTEANTRLLLEKNNWSGLIIDCDVENIERIRSSDIYWRHSLNAVNAFIDCENINKLLVENKVIGEIGVLSIDVDGVDYWIWDAITAVSPQIVICEYNGLFGSGAKVTVPYDPKFDRTKKHYSWLYAGASLAALDSLGRKKGYTLVGTNSGGNNAFFVRNDILASSTICISETPYTKPMFRESRNQDGSLSYLDSAQGIDLIGDMEVIDVSKDICVKIRNVTI